MGYALPDELRRIPAAGGSPLTIARVNRSRGASWGDDGTIVFAASPNSGLSRVSASGGEPQPITTLNAEAKEVTHRWPQMLPGSDAVLFTTHTNSTGGFDNASVEVVRLSTGERQVIHKGGSHGQYVPSGHVVYAHNGSLFAVPFDVGRLTATGPPMPVVQNLRVNAAEGVAHFTFAENGLLMYLEGDQDLPTHQVVWVDRDGASASLVAERGTYANPRLSPDGTRLSMTVYSNRNWDIWVYDLERRVSTRVTFDESTETEQIWSPDGKDLIYSVEPMHGRQALHRKPADGSGAATPVWEGDASMWAQSWSPDGRAIALTTASLDVASLDLSIPDGQPTPIVETRFAETDPAISPDGRWLAYTSAESGRTEIYVRSFATGGGRWQVSTGGGGYARWSRDGAELFYRTATGIMVAGIDRTANGLRPTTTRQVVTGDFVGGPAGVELGAYVFGDYDVSADGRRFVMFPKPPEDSDKTVGMVTMVTNWFADLSRSDK